MDRRFSQICTRLVSFCVPSSENISRKNTALKIANTDLPVRENTSYFSPVSLNTAILIICRESGMVDTNAR